MTAMPQASQFFWRSSLAWVHCPMRFVMACSTLALWLLPVGISAQELQSVTRPVSDHADGINRLWWVMFGVATAVFLGVMTVLGVGLYQHRRGGDQLLSERASRYLVITAGLAIPLLTVAALVGGSLTLGRSIAAEPPAGALQIRVTGWMWWWQIEYLDERGEVVATTANEMHIPVGRPVHLLLESADVIHSFWVPQLQGKTDMVPGRTNESWFTAREAGSFRGQCAEFCGRQHALMAFLVIAEPAEDFARWLQHQAEPATTPQTEQQRRGLQVFLSSGCQSCHRVRGTEANGPHEHAPDLTHIASRETLAAVTRRNNRGHLAGWIADPQSTKPGAKMPRTRLQSQQLTDLVAYLASLK